MSFENLERLLVGSVPTACANLTSHLMQCFESDAHAKTFYEFLPKLCQILYGSKESRGWLHLPLSKAEEQPLFELIQPKGILMRFLLSRYLDTGFIYEMNADSFPRRTQSKLDPAHYLSLPSIYLARVNLVKTTATIGDQKAVAQITRVNLNFNMLEYFLFYFAYALTLDDDDINGRGMRRTDPKLAFKISAPPPVPLPAGANRQTTWATGAAPKPPTSRVLVDGSFFNLYQRYLGYFLPAPERPRDSSSPVPEQGFKPRPSNIFTDQIIEHSADRHQTQLSISEFFVGTLVELWMCQNDRSVDNRMVRYVQPGADVAECLSVLISHLASHDISQYVLGGDQLPTHVVDTSGKSVLNAAGMARRSAYQYIRPQLYLFLKAGIQFWPLDDTFPSLIDTWMTWITPWRYGRRDPSVSGDVVSEKWQPFVFDNLLFYTSLLTLYLPRLSDPPQSNRTSITPAPLTLTKELRSIQKVMKVYKAEQLKEILKIAEQVLVWPENFTESSYAAFEPLSEAGLSLGSSRPDATSAFLASMTRALQAQVNQFEGHHHKYESLFLVEGPARSKIRMILIKLGNAIILRQERINAIEAKDKPVQGDSSVMDMAMSAVSNFFAQPPPKVVAQDPAIYKREVKALQDTKAMVGEVFDLYPSIVESFEKQQQGTLEHGSAMTPEQLDALISPVEESESRGLLGAERRRRYVPKGLQKKPIDDVVGSGRRAEELVLSYEVEFLVNWTRQGEAYLTPKWQSLLQSLPLPLPDSVRTSKVPLRWLASIPNLACISMVILAFLVLSMLSSSLGQVGEDSSGPGSRQGPYVQKAALREVTDNTRTFSRYDPHVQPVIKYEKPGSTTRRLVPTPVRQTQDPQYTIELEGI